MRAPRSPGAAPSANAIYSSVKEPRFARRLAQRPAASNRGPAPTISGGGSSVGPSTRSRSGAASPSCGCGTPRAFSKRCGPRALVCSSRHAARSLITTDDLTSAPHARETAPILRPPLRTGSRHPVGSYAAAVRGPRLGAREGLLPGRVRSILRASWPSSRAVATMRTARAPTG
jgi:hypothetical protein